jgi:hypothetical protein
MSDKINEEHISTFLRDSGENMRLQHKGQTQNRVLLFLVVLIVAALVGFICCNFKSAPEIVEKIILAAGGFIGGALGGFGYGKFKKD